jgi:hypothetical protein
MAGRFILNGRIKLRFLTTLPTVPTAPTQAELNAGVNVLGTPQAEELAEIAGFEVQTSSLPTPGYAGVQVGNVAGESTFPDSALVFYKDDVVTTIFTAMAQGATGYLAIMRDGQAATKEVELFPVTVASRVRSVARNAPHTFRANMSIGAPYQGTQAA